MSRRVRVLVIAVVGLLAAGATIAMRLDTADPESSALAESLAGVETTTTTAPTTTTTVDPAEEGFLAAHAAVPSVALYASASDPNPIGALSNPTAEQVPLVFLVRDEQGSRFKVLMPERPNSVEAWIDQADVITNEVPNRILVEVGARRLTVFEGHSDRALVTMTVAVGSDATPTPLGEFYVDISVAQNTYTPWILSVSGFSEVLTSFGGGRGQIAIHGWSDPSVLGQNISNGCVRVNFDDLWRLRDLAPVGTPVEIVA